ncbi:MAG: hypothetical protein HYY40_06500 [Bacteroidetes bacterium]|nr:hypothetical protein [Bacteroidota bacterium]
MLILSACKKRCQTKLEGQWELVNVVNATDTLHSFWIFGRINGGSGTLTYEMRNADNTLIATALGRYYLNTKFTKCLVDFEDSKGESSNAWEILRLNKKELVIIKKGHGITLKEFCKTRCN